jgi:hypothetical protein
MRGGIFPVQCVIASALFSRHKFEYDLDTLSPPDQRIGGRGHPPVVPIGTREDILPLQCVGSGCRSFGRKRRKREQTMSHSLIRSLWHFSFMNSNRFLLNTIDIYSND